MHPPTTPPRRGPIVYPESDGKPMAENTKQLRWILMLVGNLAALFQDREDVFVAGDAFWYPVEGDPNVRLAPDVFVVFGRPKGDRGSYKQWEEGGVPMTVVFEILSPGNTVEEMREEYAFYEEHGVEEYYLYPRVRGLKDFVSPRLDIRFDFSGEEMVVYGPGGKPFCSFEELEAQRRDAEKRADSAEKRADSAEKRAARLAELSRKALQGQTTPEELQELHRLVEASSPPSS